VSNHQDVAVALEDGARKGLGQHFGDVMVRWHEVDGDEASVDPLATLLLVLSVSNSCPADLLSQKILIGRLWSGGELGHVQDVHEQ
jgi:hypothetical protein